MKKAVSVILILVLMALCSCGESNGPVEPSGSFSSSQSQSAPSSTSEERDEKDELIEKLTSEIDTLNSRLEEMTGISERLASLEEMFGVEYKDGEYVYKSGHSPFKKAETEITFHDEYDDTSVVNAYLSGDASELNARDKAVYDAASAVISEIITGGMSDYEKELTVHDWICNNIEYDSENLAAIPAASKYSHTPYGALKYRRAICVGYATTFKLFLDMLSIDNRLVHVNNDEGEEHCWNLVKIGDGWYHADTTWDMSAKDTTPYFYFNMTDGAAKRCGFFKSRDDLPAADSIEYNYYYLHGTRLDGKNDIKAAIKKLAGEGGGTAQGFILDGVYEENEIRTTVVSALEMTGFRAYISHMCSAENKTVFAVCLKKS